MRRSLAFVAPLLVLAACTTAVYTARYDIDLIAVSREKVPLRAGGGHRFEDDLVKVTWTPFDSQLGMILVNKSRSPQRVLWNDVRYVGPNRVPERVVHEEKEPTTIAPGATLLELIEPVSHVRAGNTPLIGFTRGTSEAAVRSRMVHGTIEVLLPIEMDGNVREYSFRFSIKGSVVPSGWSS